MKKLFFFACLLPAVMATAGQTPAPSENNIRITGTRLTYPLINKWIAEFTRTHPNVHITVSRIPAESADLLIVSHMLKPGDLKEGQQAIALTCYVQLPVVNSRRSDVQVLQAKGFDDAAFRQVYFEETGRYTVYKRAQPACASIAFANHFGSEQQDIKGRGVVGDDKDLLAAVKKDTGGVSYNSLGFVYDISTRKVVDSIAIVPIDLDNNGRLDAGENIYGSLDEVLSFVERTHHPRIPLDNVNVLLSKGKADKNIITFLQWVLTTGQQYNHAYGFINLDAGVAQSEERQLAYSFAHH